MALSKHQDLLLLNISHAISSPVELCKKFSGLGLSSILSVGILTASFFKAQTFQPGWVPNPALLMGRDDFDITRVVGNFGVQRKP